MAKPKETMESAVFRAPTHELEAMKIQAEREGCSFSNWVRRACMKELKR